MEQKIEKIEFSQKKVHMTIAKTAYRYGIFLEFRIA